MAQQRVTIHREPKKKRTGEYPIDSETMGIRSDKTRMTGAGPITGGNGRTRLRKPMEIIKSSDLERTMTGRTSKC